MKIEIISWNMIINRHSRFYRNQIAKRPPDLVSSTRSHGLFVPYIIAEFFWSIIRQTIQVKKVQDLKVSSANGIQRCDMASIDEDQARYSDKLVRTQLLRLVVFPSDLTKLFPSGGSCGQARHFWAVSKPCWPVKTRGELSLQQFKSFCLTLSFRRLRPCANTGASTSLERYTTAAQRKS